VPLDKPHAVLVPKLAICDIESLREIAWALARTWAFNQSDHGDSEEGEEIAFWFENPNVAVLFQGHCAKNGIPSRPRWPEISN
jgi:hypothetical protein